MCVNPHQQLYLCERYGSVIDNYEHCHVYPALMSVSLCGITLLYFFKSSKIFLITKGIGKYLIKSQLAREMTTVL